MRKTMTETKRAVLLCLAVSLVLTLVGCGAGSKKYAVNEKFKLDDYTYALEKWERVPDKDTDTTNGYNVCLLIEQGEAPIIISNGQTTSGIDLTLTAGEETISPGDISFVAVNDVEGFGGRATFSYQLPKDKELPQEGTLINNSNKEETVALDLSGLPGAEG